MDDNIRDLSTKAGPGAADTLGMYKQFTNRGYVLNVKGFGGAIEMFKCKVQKNMAAVTDFYPN